VVLKKESFWKNPNAMSGEIFSKKEAYDAQKQEKTRFQKRRNFGKSAKKFAVWIVVLMTVLFTGAGALVSLQNTSSQAPRISIEDYVARFPIQSREHIKVGESHPAYNSNPPTSGWHYEEEAKWRIYDEELPDEQLVHNLEHCGIWISYQPAISSSTKSAIAAFARQFPTKIIVTPRAKNDAPISLASWGLLMKLSDFDQDKMGAFVAAFINKNGPECGTQ